MIACTWTTTQANPKSNQSNRPQKAKYSKLSKDNKTPLATSTAAVAAKHASALSTPAPLPTWHTHLHLPKYHRGASKPDHAMAHRNLG